MRHSTFTWVIVDIKRAKHQKQEPKKVIAVMDENRKPKKNECDSELIKQRELELLIAETSDRIDDKIASIKAIQTRQLGLVSAAIKKLISDT